MTSPQPRLYAFSWDRLDDFAALVNAVQGLKGTPAAADPAFMAERLRVPGMDAESDCLLASLDGALIGYTLLNWELPIGSVVLEGGVLPERRRKGVGSELFAWAKENGRSRGAGVARAPSPETDAELAGFLQGQGFSEVRLHDIMRWATGLLPEPDLPPGIVSRLFRAGDEAQLAEAQNAAFKEQWGFSPNTVEQIAYAVGMSRTTPEGVALLLDGGDVAAYCLTQTVGQAPELAGSVFMLGAHPRYQGLGLGRAALLAGMRLLLDRGVKTIELTVDAENDAAKQLYDSVGYQRVNGRRWFEANLTEG
ncbi:MAG: GNAT family N-acetyltransferase [Chloroflexi bacterium]|nr:GNAT family N-acetyltransferase [Chloroflexota bacterium]